VTPEYLEQLADLADPEQLWRLPAFDRETWTPEKRRQLDTAVALRRHADHVRRVQALLGTGKSLVVTPLFSNGTATMTIDAPPKHKALLALHEPPRVDPRSLMPTERECCGTFQGSPHRATCDSGKPTPGASCAT
jgi:hypothetical protein